MCDDFVVTSGKAPDVVKNPRDPSKDRYLRPQVFSPDAGVELTLAMTPMARCEVTLRLQTKGTEKLGDWDKLAGVVFGCSTREGRRILALPEVSQKMDEFIDRFLEAHDKRDPQLLAAAYVIVADAFADVGDAEEATKWRRKSEAEAEKAKRPTDDRPSPRSAEGQPGDGTPCR